ncbi:putative Tetratricopeptide repeat protein 4 like protein [Blattamonas nauphoetae]|uniref:Tetratricopeptide repeat protein 4 like protein n=1 Tax=Blattamonas nauphoetae TaxID=2049346 RepID=A0ABQ9YLM0_9EUKA|nr:putative Tetratricopeptide repeat protein 4 like protein [Blattamonas nauphoetae]
MADHHDDIVIPAPASDIFSVLPTTQALDDGDDDWVIPPGWKPPADLPKDLPPIFADSIPNDFEERADFAGLQSMIYDNPPAVIADHYKIEGNNYLKKGKEFYDKAIKSYTLALDQNSPDLVQVSIYYANRAQVHLLKGNFGRCIEDCVESLKNNSGYTKAYYRKGKAELRLGRIDEASKTVSDGLKTDPENKELATLLAEVQKAIHQKEEREQRAKQAALDGQQLIAAKYRAFKAKGYRLGLSSLHEVQEGCHDPLFFIPKQADDSLRNAFEVPQIKPNTLSELSQVIAAPKEFCLRTPVLFCYPEYSQTDLIQAVSEQDQLHAHLANLLPLGKHKDGHRDRDDDDPSFLTDYPPWDKKQRYSLRNVRAFFRKDWVKEKKTDVVSVVKEENEWFEVPLDCSVARLLSHPDYVIPKIRKARSTLRHVSSFNQGTMTRRIFCGNLNFNTNAQALGELFETVGVVQHVTIMSRCDKSLGYGFVEMESDTQAQRAVSALNGRELDGRKLVVELDVAKDNSDDPTVLQKLPDDLLIYNDFQQRRSIRRYTSQDIPDPVIQRILSNVINNVPTAGNLQAYHVLVIRNPETKEKLAHASHSQPQVKSCQVLLVFLANPRASEEKYKARGRDLAYQDIDGRTATVPCFVSLIVGAILALAGAVVGLIFGFAKHFQLIFTAISVLTMLIPMIYLGISYKRGKAERKYVYIMMLMLIPTLFGSLSAFTSIHITADNYVKCLKAEKGGFYHAKYKECITCQTNYCINVDFVLKGNNPPCILVNKGNQTHPDYLCATSAPRPTKLV